MPEKPPPGIVRFVNGDPVNPSLQRALPAEMIDVPKHFQKDFLDYIGCLGGTDQQADSQGIDGLLKSREQLLVRPLRSTAQGLDQTLIVTFAGSSFRVQVQNRGGHRQPHNSA